ncbi:protein transport protein Sec24A-like isoform X3 [Ruditapes philippinarum]|uniref:protein transport protein Sec24A-like isoform X3 n=1 Tax=Ruditapes philippinarum TaxID=129788 RepID=UPI00295B9469|nr:protein transport protein Sec24A-like isoform X3 [Ruditapes philippinarum]
MANVPNSNPNWQNRPPVSMQQNAGVPFGGPRPPLGDNMQLKAGQTMNGPAPYSEQQGQPFFRPPSSVNGVSTPPMSQGNMQQNGQFSGVRPPLPGGPAINGPNQGPPFQGPQFNQPRQGFPGPSGQIRPGGPLPNVRPFTGAPPSSQSAFRPPQAGGASGLPTFPTPASQSGLTRPPFSDVAQSQADRPNELPVPFHGHGQYSHQVGMALTPGITPSNSGPPSQKSSRTNSPAVINQNFDALEGQFRGTPEQEIQPVGNPQQQWNSPPNSSTAFRQPGMPPTSSFPGMPPTSQQGMPPMSQQGMPPTSSIPGMPPTSQPGIPPTSSFPGVPPTSQGMPPTSSISGMPPTSSFPGMPPTSQQGMPPTSGFPGMSPTSQQGVPPTSQQGMPPTSQQRFMSPTVSSQGTGFPPSVSQGSRFPQAQRPGFPPVSAGQQQPGFRPMSAPSQRPGFPPTSMGMQPGFPPASTANQQPRFPPAPPSSNQVPGFTPASVASQQPGFPPVPPPTNQMPGFTPASSANQLPGFPPPPPITNQVPGFGPSANQQQRFPPPPTSTATQQPGFPPQPNATNPQPGFPPQPNSVSQQPGFPPQPNSASQQPGFPPQPNSVSQQPGFPPQPNSASQQPGFPPQPNSTNQYQGQGQQYAPHGKTVGEFVNSYPKQNAGFGAMASNFNNLSLQGTQSINLLQQKKLIPPDGVETPKPVIPNDNRNVNCNPEVFRCTMNNIPQTSALLNKSRLPLGILIHPFKDLSQLPVIQSSVIVRCRSCRTYINPFVYFVDSRRWKCNLCYRVNELPDEFSFDPVSKSYGDPQRRPEIKSATIEFIAPSEYMLRPPQPAVYIYLLDVSFNAIETGYLTTFCETLMDVLDRIPGDSRTQIGFIAYDSSVHFFNLAEGLSQPQMLTVTDVDDIFLPCPDNLLVNLNECKNLVNDLLNQLPTLFENNMETRSALGAALQAAFKMTTSTGGRVTVMQTVLPTYGPGALQNREDSTQKTSKDISSLGPATDFYKKLALDCSAQQIAVDLYMFNGQYADIASIECISKFSGGCVSYYPSYHAVRSPHLAEKFETDLRRYMTRKIGFESVMRIRCSKGISIHTFHGNFFVRSTDLLSLPNVNPDAGFGMQMSIEEPLTDMSTMCFQAALLYTSSKGERRIRVHTLCLPVTNQISEIHAGADQQAIIALLAKMAVDRSISSSMSDAREAIVNAAIDILNSYGSTLAGSQRAGGLCASDQLKLIPLYCLSLLKSTAFRTGVSTRLDDRTFALNQCKTLPVAELIRLLYPDLYPIHTIMDVDMVKKGSLEYPKLPLLQLSSANVDRNGAYLLDTGDTIYLYLGSAVNPQFCQDVFDRPNFASIQEGGITELPELENEGSERVRAFITYLLDIRSNGSALVVVREDGKLRMKFFQHFVEDRTESSISYVEFLQQIQQQIKS